jgi:hypothetical protein
VIVIALLLGDYDADCRVTMMSDYYGRSFARTHFPVGKSWQVRGKLDGWEVAQHAREIEPDFPVVYMSVAAAADWTSKGVPNSIIWPSHLLQPSFSLLSPICSTVRRRRLKATQTATGCRRSLLIARTGAARSGATSTASS